MSEPNRYTLEMVSSEGGEVHWMHDNGQGLNAPLGDYVLYSDYARLNAEVERLRASSFVTAVPVEEYEKLKAEVERLRKAGDAMANWFCPVAGAKSFPAHIVYEAWNAAKEGKQP